MKKARRLLHDHINALTAQFFAAFDNRSGAPALDVLHAVCLSEVIVSKCVGDTPEVMSLDAFIAPRRRWLADGTLTGFAERETHAETQIQGRIAQRWSRYAKSGCLNGTALHATGTKAIQFIKTSGGWRISAVAWDDDV